MGSIVLECILFDCVGKVAGAPGVGREYKRKKVELVAAMAKRRGPAE